MDYKLKYIKYKTKYFNLKSDCRKFSKKLEPKENVGTLNNNILNVEEEEEEIDTSKDYKVYKCKYNYDLFTLINFNQENNFEVINNYDFQFLDVNKDGKISKEEYSEQLKKYFSLVDLKVLDLILNYNKTNLKDQLPEYKLDFDLYDNIDKDGEISKNELLKGKFSNNLRYIFNYIINAKEVYPSYDKNNNILTKGNFKGMSSPDFLRRTISTRKLRTNILKFLKDFDFLVNNIYKFNLYFLMRYLVEVKGINYYINLENPENDATKAEYEIFNSLCNSNCKYVPYYIEDGKTISIEKITYIVKLIEKIRDNNYNGVMHCSAGMGRTGYLIICYLLKQEKMINNPNYVILREELDILTLTDNIFENSQTKREEQDIPYGESIKKKLKEFEIFKFITEKYNYETAEELILQDENDLLKSKFSNMKIFLDGIDIN